MQKQRFIGYLSVLIFILIEVISMSRNGEGASTVRRRLTRRERNSMTSSVTNGHNADVESGDVEGSTDSKSRFLIPIIITTEVYDAANRNKSREMDYGDLISGVLPDLSREYDSSESGASVSFVFVYIVESILSGICKVFQLMIHLLLAIVRMSINFFNPLKYFGLQLRHSQLTMDGDEFGPDYSHISRSSYEQLERASSRKIPNRFIQQFVQLANSICEHKSLMSSSEWTNPHYSKRDRSKRSVADEIPPNFVTTFKNLVNSICSFKSKSSSPRQFRSTADLLASENFGPATNRQKSPSTVTDSVEFKLRPSARSRRLKMKRSGSEPKNAEYSSDSSISHHRARDGRLRFKLYTQELNWYEAEHECQNEKGALALPRDESEYERMILYAKGAYDIGDTVFFIGKTYSVYQRKKHTQIGDRRRSSKKHGDTNDELCGVIYISDVDYQGYGHKPCTEPLYFMCEFRYPSE